MSNAPTLINLPPPPAEPFTPSDIPGTPNSTTTSISELSTIAIKDGHRGHMPHHQHSSYHPSGLNNQLDAERADRISRLAGLERVTTARNPPSVGNLTPGAAAPPLQTTGYFDANGTPVMGRERSTVGSASATGSVGGRTTWAESEGGDADKMSESQDMEMEDSSVEGLSEETGSLVGFGEGARTPARQSVISGATVPKGAFSNLREARNFDGQAYDAAASDSQRRAAQGSAGPDAMERDLRDDMDTTSADRMRLVNQ